MNYYTSTFKIIKEPKWLRLNNLAISKLVLVKPSNKKNINYYTILAIAKREIAEIIFNRYKKNDTIIIEGYIYIKKKQIKFKNNKKKYKIKKYALVKIQKIHNV